MLRSKEKFLKKCKKTFKDKDLILFNGLYPFNLLIKRRGLNLTREHLMFCDLILKTYFPFIIEKKINAPCLNNFYIDVLVKAKYHFISFEIDGQHHYLNKEQRIRDIKKAIWLVKYYETITVRVKNKLIIEYKENPDPLDNLLKFLYTKLFNKFNKHLFFAEQIGKLKKMMREVKKK